MHLNVLKTSPKMDFGRIFQISYSTEYMHSRKPIFDIISLNAQYFLALTKHI